MGQVIIVTHIDGRYRHLFLLIFMIICYWPPQLLLSVVYLPKSKFSNESLKGPAILLVSTAYIYNVLDILVTHVIFICVMDQLHFPVYLCLYAINDILIGIEG